MYKSFFLLDSPRGLSKGKRVHIGDLPGKDENWLRDTLFSNPEIIPVNEIDPTFGPLIPLCKELPTGQGGRIDVVFINEHGRLTIVECKLWKNPQARREVVAQTLDYVSALSSWTYADLQRSVSEALSRKGNVPFALVQEKLGSNAPAEADFVDSVSRSLREGRFLALIAGDGFRDGVEGLTNLVNRNSSKAFSFGLVEVALYDLNNGQLAIQPRVLAETKIITRQVVTIDVKGISQGNMVVEDTLGDEDPGPPRGSRTEYKRWWQPVLNMTFDDPEQEPPYWVGTNNVVLKTPFPGILIKAYAVVDGTKMGVFVSGIRNERTLAIKDFVSRDQELLRTELPEGTEILEEDPRWPIIITEDSIHDEKGRHDWLIAMLNSFVNSLRPRLKKWYAEANQP